MLPRRGNRTVESSGTLVDDTRSDEEQPFQSRVDGGAISP